VWCSCRSARGRAAMSLQMASPSLASPSISPRMSPRDTSALELASPYSSVSGSLQGYASGRVLWEHKCVGRCGDDAWELRQSNLDKRETMMKAQQLQRELRSQMLANKCTRQLETDEKFERKVATYHMNWSDDHHEERDRRAKRHHWEKHQRTLANERRRHEERMAKEQQMEKLAKEKEARRLMLQARREEEIRRRIELKEKQKKVQQMFEDRLRASRDMQREFALDAKARRNEEARQAVMDKQTRLKQTQLRPSSHYSPGHSPRGSSPRGSPRGGLSPRGS